MLRKPMCGILVLLSRPPHRASNDEDEIEKPFEPGRDAVRLVRGAGPHRQAEAQPPAGGGVAGDL